jgi:CAAX protease family protein
MQPVDLAITASFLLVWPLYGARWGRPALQAAVAAGIPGARRTEYVGTIVFLWMFSGLAAAAALERGLSAHDLRLLPPVGIVPIAISIVAVVGAFVLFHLQGGAVRSAEGRAALRRAAEPLAWFLPQDARDQRVFRGVSVTAGICEEWLVRGWLVALLTPLTGVVGAFVISAVLFGIAHAYQGLSGIVKTGTVGLILSALAWATGSLWAPILVHAIADWMQGDLFVRVFEPEKVEANAVAAA